MTRAALALAALVAGAAAGPAAAAPAAAPLEARVRAYLGAVDVPVTAEQWRALGEEAVPLLEAALASEPLPSRRTAAIAGLRAIGGARARAAVVEAARDEAQPAAVRAAAARAAARLVPPVAVPPAATPPRRGAATPAPRRPPAPARTADGPACPAPAQRTEPLELTAPAPGTCPFLPPTPPAWPAEWGVEGAAYAVGTPIEWEVPAGVSGMTVTLEALRAVPEVPLAPSTSGKVPNAAEPIQLAAPDGTVWWRLDPDTERPDDPVSLRGPRAGVGSLVIPNTTRALELVAQGGLPAGRWTMTVGDLAYGCATVPELDRFCGPGAGLDPPPDLDAYRAGQYRVSLLLRGGPIPERGTVDVAFYLHRSFAERPLRAADAAGDPDLQRLLASLQAWLAPAGLCVGEVAWLDLPEWAQGRWAAGADTSTACEGSFHELFTLALPGARLNVFLVPGVTFDGEPAQGFTSAVPGTPGLAGTIHSGLALSSVNLRASAACGEALAPSACGPDSTALIAAHEIGHFLGLYHPTERHGRTFDPLADTPTCDCRACAPEAERPRCEDRSAAMQPAWCHAGATCGGATNLMFWLQWNAPGAPPLGELSPEQRAILLANPLVR